jgi:nitrate/nitrite transporter NarK
MTLFALVFAGEIIFSLPFQVPRFFRPTVLDVFGFSNADLGDVFAVYGVIAMLAYFPGGVISDYFSDRKLMTVSLLATGLGGLYMATVPPFGWAAVVYGYWGATTILLFWAALIRATREWGGHRAQGRAFGILDGGRGLVAAGAASVAVLVLSNFLPDDVETASDEARRAGLAAVVYFYTVLTFTAAALVWFLVPETGERARRINPFSGVLEVLRRPVVWAQAAIVVCAYCGFKALDYYSLYAVEVLGMDEVEGARLTATASYLRPVAAIAAGVVADRFVASRTIGAVFGVLCASYGLLALATPTAAWLTTIYGSVLLSFFCVFALRGIYFALLEETRTRAELTGTAVGLISVLGYTPDVFFAPIAGRILDNAPGLAGHQHFFAVLAAIMLVGVVITVALVRRRA